MKPQLIVFDGLDGAGKTSTIEEIIRTDSNKFFYCKGLGSNTRIGEYAKTHPSFFIFMAELAYISNFIMNRKIREGNIILQDRYTPSIYSFSSDINPIQSFLGNFLLRFIRKIDALVYLTVDEKERINRLKKSIENLYHFQLINHPEVIREREALYSTIYLEFKGPKIKVDTTHLSLGKTSQICREFLHSL